MPKIKYVHATSSEILPFLPMTGFQLHELDILLYQYGIAPLSGEIFCGGVNSITSKVDTAFADIHDNHHWSFESIIKSYGGHTWRQSFDSQATLKKELDDFCDNNFYRCKTLIVKLLRDFQMGVLPDINLDTQEKVLSYIESEYEKTVKSYASNYAVAKYITEQEERSYEEGQNNLTFLYNTLEENLPANFLALDEDTQLAIMLKMDLPDKLQIEPLEIDDTKKQINFSNALNRTLNSVNDGLYKCHTYKTEVLFYKNENEQPNLDYAKATIAEKTSSLQRAVKLLSAIITGNAGKKLDIGQQALVNNSFPIVFVLENNQFLAKHKDEFRATCSLKLGVQIKTLATTAQNKQRLIEYCQQHPELRKVTILSLEELKQSCNEVKLSQVPQAHFNAPHRENSKTMIPRDVVPRLKTNPLCQ